MVGTLTMVAPAMLAVHIFADAPILVTLNTTLAAFPVEVARRRDGYGDRQPFKMARRDLARLYRVDD